MKNKKAGFTLIEMMVVIAIIAVLSTIVFSAVSRTRLKSRDAKRIADITSMENALALMHDAHGGFPCHYLQEDNREGIVSQKFMQPFVDEGFLSVIPRDKVYKYEYLTIHATPDEYYVDPVKMTQQQPTCLADYALLGVYFEDPSTPCPTFGVTGTDFINGVEGKGHCHIWFPEPFPDPNICSATAGVSQDRTSRCYLEGYLDRNADNNPGDGNWIPMP